jgi:anti-sigma factor (TIGR02949 family)
MTAPHGSGSRECRELFGRLSEYLDGELDPSVCDETDQHLGECAPCQEFLESLRRSVAILKRVPGEPLPEEMRVAMRQALRRLQEERGFK